MRISEVEWIIEKIEEPHMQYDLKYAGGYATREELDFIKEILYKQLEKYSYEDGQADIEVII